MVKWDTSPGNAHKEAVKVAAAEKAADLFAIDATASDTLQGNAPRLVALGVAKVKVVVAAVAVEEIASIVGNLATGAGSVPRPQVDLEEDRTVVVLMVAGRVRAEATATNVASQDHTIAWGVLETGDGDWFFFQT